MKSDSNSMTQPRGRPRTFDRNAALVEALKLFWRKGYEVASIEELCRVMGIKPPSLYAAFGNKAKLFLETVNYYERLYWDDAWAAMAQETDLLKAIEGFFRQAAMIMTSQEVPCGCLVVLAVSHVSPDSTEVYQAVKALREEGRVYFKRRLDKAITEGQLPADTDTSALALTLNTLLEGMSIPAQDGLSQQALLLIAAGAVRLLPALPQH